MKKTNTALITGGTSGVGLSMVRTLADQDWEVHFIGRNQAKGKQIESEIHHAGKGKAIFIEQDLGRLREVKSLAEKLAHDLDHLDLLGNVAGVVRPKREETEEGSGFP